MADIKNSTIISEKPPILACNYTAVITQQELETLPPEAPKELPCFESFVINSAHQQGDNSSFAFLRIYMTKINDEYKIAITPYVDANPTALHPTIFSDDPDSSWQACLDTHLGKDRGYIVVPGLEANIPARSEVGILADEENRIAKMLGVYQQKNLISPECLAAVQQVMGAIDRAVVIGSSAVKKEHLLGWGERFSGLQRAGVDVSVRATDNSPDSTRLPGQR